MLLANLRNFLICALSFSVSTLWLAAYWYATPFFFYKENMFYFTPFLFKPMFSRKQLGRKTRGWCVCDIRRANYSWRIMKHRNVTHRFAHGCPPLSVPQLNQWTQVRCWNMAWKEEPKVLSWCECCRSGLPRHLKGYVNKLCPSCYRLTERRRRILAFPRLSVSILELVRSSEPSLFAVTAFSSEARCTPLWKKQTRHL
jgi:hypothetical protein